MSRPARRATLAALAPLVAAALGGCRAEPGGDRTFSYAGVPAAGHWVHVHDANGPIRVAPSPDDTLRILGQAQGDGPTDLHFRYDSAGGDVTVCVYYGHGSCSSRGASGGGDGLLARLFHRGSRQAPVTFTIAIPRTLRLDASTISGQIVLAAPATETRLRAVNGSIVADSVHAPLSATTVNGSITARLASLALPLGASRDDGDSGDAAVSLKSVNGSLTALLPDDAAGEVDLATVNGRVLADHPRFLAQESSGHHRHRIHGTLGAGGPTISLKTVNGSVALHRG